MMKPTDAHAHEVKLNPFTVLGKVWGAQLVSFRGKWDAPLLVSPLWGAYSYELYRP